MKKRNLQSKRMTWLIAGILIAALLGVGFYCCRGQINSTQIIIVAVVILFAMASYLLYTKTTLQFHTFVFIVTFVFCALNSFIQPIFNIPDETTHFNHAMILSEGTFFIDRHADEYVIDQSVVALNQDTEKTVFEADSAFKAIDKTPGTTEKCAPSHLFIYYIPQAIGVLIARLFNMKAVWMMWLARIMGALAYAGLAVLAIKIAPKMKRFLFFVLFLPMAVQQGGSCNVDIFVNGLSILFIALFIKMYCEPECPKYVGWLLLFMLLGLLQTFIKVTDVFLCGLILLLPLKERFGKKGIWIKIGGLLLFIIAGLAYYYYTTTFGGSPSAYVVENAVDAGRQLQYILANPLTWLINFVKAALMHIPEYAHQLFVFGWLKDNCIYLAPFFVVLFVRQCWFCDQMPVKTLNKVLVVLMALGVFGSTCLALYITWTPVGSADILGVQGRYFIPAMGLIPIVFARMKKQPILSATQNNIDMALSIFMTSAMLISIVGYYY